MPARSPGSFCWSDTKTRDVDAISTFLTDRLSWTHAPGTAMTPAAPEHAGPEPDAMREFYRGLGLDDLDVPFTRADAPSTWVARVHGAPRDLLTPAGTPIRPA